MGGGFLLRLISVRVPYYQPPCHNCFHLPVVFRCIRKTAKSDYLLSHLCRTAWKNSTPTGRIFIQGGVWVFLDSLSIIFKFHWNLTRKRVLYMKTNIKFWSYLVQFFIEREMFQTKVVDKIKTHLCFQFFFFWKSCHLWDNVKNTVEPDRPQMTIGCMRNAYCIRADSHYTSRFRSVTVPSSFRQNGLCSHCPSCSITFQNSTR
jgi:hypothetical protein